MSCGVLSHKKEIEYDTLSSNFKNRPNSTQYIANEQWVLMLFYAQLKATLLKLTNR